MISEMGLRVVVNPEIPVGINPAKQPGEDLMSYDNKLMDENMGCIEPGVLKRAHAVLAATHKSFCLHLPLVFKPDHILITVMQSLAMNIQREPEKFAKALGALEGAKKRQVTVYADTRNPDWNRVFENFRIALGESFGTHVTSQSQCDFSTSCFGTKNVANLTLMHAYSHFATFKVGTLCGIPVVHLLGTQEDWNALVQKIDKLSKIFISLDWWFDKLKPVVGEIASLWTKEPDVNFWKDFYNYANNSGSYAVTGHINAFFPVLLKIDLDLYRQPEKHEYKQNHWFDKKRRNPMNSFRDFPHMTSTVDFIQVNPDKTEEKMTAHANLDQIVTVFTNGVMPFCTWQIKNNLGEICGEGHELRSSDGPKLDIHSLNIVRQQSEEDANLQRINKVLLPCWHVISCFVNNQSEISFQLPPICPECSVPVEKAVDTI